MSTDKNTAKKARVEVSAQNHKIKHVAVVLSVPGQDLQRFKGAIWKEAHIFRTLQNKMQFTAGLAWASQIQTPYRRMCTYT